MANKPVLGIIDCPHCGRANMVGWNGNYKVPCFYCKKKFMVKRTRLHHNETRKVGATEYWDDKAYRVQNGKLMKEAAHEMD